MRGVASRIGVDARPQLRPAADVRPLEIGGHEQELVGLFEHASVDDLDWQPRVERRRGLLIAGQPRLHHLAQPMQVPRRMRLKLTQEHVNTPGEPGEVPEVAARLQEPLGRAQVRLLREALHAPRAVRAALWSVDVAETGRGEGRLQPERDEAAGGGRRLQRCAHRPPHRCAAADHVVGRHRQHDRIAILLADGQRRQAVGVGGAPRCRLDDQVTGVHLGQDRCDDLALPRLSDDVDLVR